MTKEGQIADLKPGDIIYIPRTIKFSFSPLGTIYCPEVVKRVTPKKTKAETKEMTTLDRYSTFYMEMDEEMVATNKVTKLKRDCYNNRYKMEKANLKMLDTEGLEKVASLYQQIFDICVEKQVI